MSAIDHNIGKCGRTAILQKLGSRSTHNALNRRRLYDQKTIKKAEDNRDKALERHRAAVEKYKNEEAAKKAEGSTYSAGAF